jgi:CRP-like cAMP-binding protein
MAAVGTREPLAPIARLLAKSNRLLDSLSLSDRKRLLGHCQLVELTLGEVLCEPGERIRHVYFPVRSFISLISPIDARASLEVGLVGDEGMLGSSLLLGVKLAPHRALVQGAGSAWRLKEASFCREFERSKRIRDRLNRYLYVTLRQMAQTAVCTHFHVVEARLARWLLMTGDRAHSDHFLITHQFMSYMLGVRREGITQAARALQRRKLISYRRGQVTILNRRALESVACVCYAAALESYSAILG